MAIAVPDDLAAMVADRRVIPFVGSGFSAGLGFPQWDELLKRLSEDVAAPLAYAEIRDACSGDPLQIAEYLFLHAGRAIGPLRHSITQQMRATRPLLESTPHVELVNLGAPQIYTTNYDDLIESVFKQLYVEIDTVVLPKDVALATDKRPQIVKYHGDLRHDQTLVLTESQYYTRLDLESPMDLKFRSDLLGKSVLFMGYSFRDINIRVIWFKLMRMMRDVPETDRPTSYILRFAPNEVLERLYDAVGLRTIVIDPEGTAKTPDAQTRLLSEFLLALGVKAAPGSLIPGTDTPMFVSMGLLSLVEEDVARASERMTRISVRGTRRTPFVTPSLQQLLSRLLRRAMPAHLRPKANEVYFEIARNVSFVPVPDFVLPFIQGIIHQLGANSAATLVAVRTLLAEPSRAALIEREGVPWQDIWRGGVPEEEVSATVLRLFEREIEGHDSGGFVDDDIVYAADLAARVVDGSLLMAPSEELQRVAAELLERAGAIYESIASHEPSVDGPPDVRAILDELEERHGEERASLAADDDIPF